ncbi:acyl-CoA thioesterase II [Jiella sp. MQZ9-1]|uniref:Acyl-CoA thioesterase 2 n=1 Tax=Jiella flava TaxID=2816857 RepID=A0A939FXH7_9HYPH|nr:acyl-CoA thioesterase II [Jiella flava]MBO0661322.1 acyl-CoA thioesterase II [Jiella flava]MCD2469967.1 acyl-CoA thioesterase II [Jiella flava]
MSDTVQQLLTILDLETLEDDLFRGVSPNNGWQRVFGGQVIAQALGAAIRTVPAERICHSLHAYFMRPGDPAVPIVYTVDRIRDGGSFTTRRVVALQHGAAIFSLSASFQKNEEGFEHQIAMPDIPKPDELPDGKALEKTILKNAPAAVQAYWKRPRPIEFRPVMLDHYISGKKLEPFQHIWVRCREDVGDDPVRNAVVLAYLSDMTLLDTALFAHGLSVFDENVQAASLDHAMWFHRPAKVSQWMLYSQDSPSSSAGRGLTRGSLYTLDGMLVASVAQEGLIRPRRSSR